MAKTITCHSDELDTDSSSGSYTINYTGGTAATIDLSGITTTPSYSCISSIALPTTTIASGGSGYTYTTASNCYTWANPVTTNTNVHINTDGIKMDEGTDIKIGNKSLKEFMLKMEERMAILVPDPNKLEKFAALKKAYENYKLLEKLCQEEDKEDK